MSKIRSRRIGVGLSLLVVGMLAGAGGAYALQLLDISRFINTSLFTVAPGEAVNFSVTLDDNRGGPAAKVLLRLLDKRGSVVARQDLVLGPGQSATLRYPYPGVLRAQAQILEPDAPLGTRRRLVSTVEIVSLKSGDASSLDLGFGIPQRFVCSSDDGGTNGRLPD
jgi:hypothetical protein